MSNQNVSNPTLFLQEAIPANETVESTIIKLSRYHPRGFFSIQYIVTGSGTVTINAEVSNDGKTFVPLTTAIATGITSASGPNTDGNDLISFNVPPCGFIKFTVEETAGSAVAVSLFAAIQ